MGWTGRRKRGAAPSGRLGGGAGQPNCYAPQIQTLDRGARVGVQ